MNSITPEQILHVSQAAEKAAAEVGLELWDFSQGGFPETDSRTFVVVSI